VPRDATYLTDKYPSAERELWTPCIHRFFVEHSPQLPISYCIDQPAGTGPWYESRKSSPFVQATGTVLIEPGPNQFFEAIKNAIRRDLSNEAGRITSAGDIAGICPDIMLLNENGIFLIENKPYYDSKFDGNQGADGAYASFVEWMNTKDVHCEYLVLCPISWPEYPKLKQLQHKLRECFGVILLEDLFGLMASAKYTFHGIQENWSGYSGKGKDYA